MFLAPAIVLLASGTADAPAKTAATPPPETTSDEPAPEEQATHRMTLEEYERAQQAASNAELRKRGFPIPPSQERAAYLAWKKKLPKKTRARIERFCRTDGALTNYSICDGIGPYAIPKPPSLVAERARDADGNLIGMSHEQWQSSLSIVQHRYYDEHCVNAPPEMGEDWGFSELCGGTPLVLSFDHAPVTFTMTAGEATDWPTASTPWIALDRDGDGGITSSAELFGSDTLLPTGALATNGFVALAPLDENHDGVVDALDPAFASLLIWTDRDGDRRSAPGELAKLADRVVSLPLANARVPRCDARGNCEGERSTMTWHDDSGAEHTGAVIDVYLHYQ